MQGAPVWSLVGELRSHMPSGQIKINKYRNKKLTMSIWGFWSLCIWLGGLCSVREDSQGLRVWDSKARRIHEDLTQFTKELSKLPCPVSGKQRDWSRVSRISEQGDQVSSQGKAWEEGDKYGGWFGFYSDRSQRASIIYGASLFYFYCLLPCYKITHAHGKEKLEITKVLKKNTRQNSPIILPHRDHHH